MTQEQVTESSGKEATPEPVGANPKLETFLKKWDRDLDEERRCYGIKICFAGAESKVFRDGLYRIGARHILLSYFYAKNWLKKATVQEIAEDLGRFDFVFLDSGGFTLMQALNEGRDPGMDLREYTEDYYETLPKIGNIFAGCAEVDVREKFEFNEMEDWKAGLLDKGVPVVPVVQGDRVEALDEAGWFEKYPYIALGSAMINNRLHVADLNALHRIGRERGVVYHGFGATDELTLLKSFFYSVDSSVGRDSWVWVRKGRVPRLIRIGDLYEEVASGVLSLDGVETQTVERISDEFVVCWRSLTDVVRHDVDKKRVGILLQTGKYLEVTTDHSLFSMTCEGELMEVTPESLSEGDWLVVPRASMWSGEGLEEVVANFDLPVTLGRGRKWHANDNEDYSIELTTEMLEFLGFWIGDGSYGGDTTIQLACGLDVPMVEVCRRMASFLSRKATVSKKNDVSISHAKFVRAMRNLGFIGGSRNKCLPEWFWSLSEEQAGSLLRGLFTAEGTGGRGPYLSTTSRVLSEQVREALQSLLGETVSWGQVGDSYRVTVTSDEAKKAFVSKVGFLLRRKETLRAREPRSSRIDTLPVELAKKRLVWPNKGPVNTQRVERGSFPGCFDKAVQSGDIQYAKILSIEELPVERTDVYDLEVPGPQRFIANGILAHNTSWLGGSRYGSTMVFQNGRIRHFDHTKKSERARFKERFEQNGLIWKDIEQDKWSEVNLMNGLAWKQWSDYIRYTAANSYWLGAEEKDAALSLKSKAFNAEGIIDRSASLARTHERRLHQIDDAGHDDRAHEVLHCDTCHHSSRCPRYKAREPCGYDINVRLGSKLDLQKALQVVLEVQHGRAMTGVLFEKLNGGVLDGAVSNELSRYITMIQQVKSIFEPESEEFTIKAKGKSGAVSQMLASVFSPTGTGGSGSGSTQTQRAAAKVIEVPPEDLE